jgi:hypothetical protein
VTASDVKRDKVNAEMVRLKMNVGLPSENIQGIDLNPEQHNQYIKLAGEWTKEHLDKVVNDSSWDKRSDYAKTKVIQSVIADGRERARDLVMKLYPELSSEAREKRKALIGK